MILSKEKEIKLQSNTVFEGYDAKISEEDIHKLWSMLQSPYKNSVGAIVREITSNCFDSHSEANVKDAVHVKIGKDDTGHYWSAEDFGVGLSPDRIESVFINYLKSTKEDSNNQIGCFGMGSKSPLSYTDWFSIRTRFDGIEYTYILRKGERTPRLEKIFEEPTTERNGTLIKIYIKETKSRYGYIEAETDKFEEECKNQLCYFDNIYFDNCGIDNDYKIIQGKHWKYNTHIKPFNSLHLVIGSVGYPIDWNNLKIEQIDFPVALRFEIGELDIIQTREDVRYTPRTVDAILNKIELLKEEFKEIWNKQDFELDNIFEYFNKVQYKDYDVEFGAYEFNLKDLFKNIESELQYFTYKKLPNVHYQLQYNFLFEYQTSRRIGKNGRSCKTSLNRNINNLFTRNNYNKGYYIEGETNPKVNKYISSIENKDIYLIEPDKSIKLKEYKYYLKLNDIPKSQWRQTIKDYQTAMRAEINTLCSSYKDVVIDSKWEEDNKIVRKKLPKGIVICQRINLGYGDTRVEIDLSKVGNGCVIIGSKEQKEEVYYLHQLFQRSVKKVNKLSSPHTTAKTNIKLFNDLKNVWTVETIMSEECKVFTRTCTAYKLKQEYSILLNINWKNYIDIYKPIADKLKEIQEFVEKWGTYELKVDTFVKNTCLPIAKEKNLYDKDILEKVKDISTYFEGLEILNYIQTKPTIIKDSRGSDVAVHLFPTAEIVKYIYNYNKINKVKSKFKRLNAYYYCSLNQLELDWLKENKEEFKFQQSKLKLVS